jgi:hypothetical protein
MTSEESERINVLIERIRNENDPRQFTKLLGELDDLLAAIHKSPVAPKPNG